MYIFTNSNVEKNIVLYIICFKKISNLTFKHGIVISIHLPRGNQPTISYTYEQKIQYINHLGMNEGV